MNHQAIQTDQAPAPVGSYSQAVWVGELLFCSGQIAIDPKTNELVLGDVKEQTQLVMENIKGLLESQRLTFTNVVKTSIFITDMNKFAQVNEVYRQYLSEPYPARSCVEVSGLPKGVDVEIEIIACKS